MTNKPYISYCSSAAGGARRTMRTVCGESATAAYRTLESGYRVYLITLMPYISSCARRTMRTVCGESAAAAAASSSAKVVTLGRTPRETSAAYTRSAWSSRPALPQALSAVLNVTAAPRSALRSAQRDSYNACLPQSKAGFAIMQITQQRRHN